MGQARFPNDTRQGSHTQFMKYHYFFPHGRSRNGQTVYAVYKLSLIHI